MEYIGFTTKYYTLWEVTTKGEWTFYNYKQNLSMDFEKAKAKRPNALVDLTLKGHHSYKVRNITPSDCFLFGKFCKEPICEHTDDTSYLVWYFNNCTSISHRNAVRKYIANDKAYTICEDDKAYKTEYLTYFPQFETKVEHNQPFRFNAKSNLKLGIDDNEREFGYINIPFCNIKFYDIQKKEYNGYNYCIPLYNNYGIPMKGKRMVIDQYSKKRIGLMEYEIIVTKFHIESIN